jgi:hypothetical protein
MDKNLYSLSGAHPSGSQHSNLVRTKQMRSGDSPTAERWEQPRCASMDVCVYVCMDG